MHAVLDWQFDESIHSEASISRYCKDLFGTSALSRCQHVTLKDFNFDSISADFAKLLSSNGGMRMSSITILWTGDAPKRYRYGLGAFLGNVSSGTTVQILAYDSAPDESVDGPVDYAYHLGEFEGTDLGVFSYEDIPFGVGWISRLVHLSINTQHVPSIVAVVKEAGMNLLNIQGLHVSDSTHGFLFELDAEIELAELLQCLPNLRRCNITLNDMSYETTAVLDALSPDIEDLTFSTARLDADIVDFIRFLQNNRLPKLRRVEANILWDYLCDGLDNCNWNVPERKQICGFTELMALRQALRDATSVQDEISISSELKTVEQDYVRRREELTVQLRNTLCYIVTARHAEILINEIDDDVSLKGARTRQLGLQVFVYDSL